MILIGRQRQACQRYAVRPSLRPEKKKERNIVRTSSWYEGSSTHSTLMRVRWCCLDKKEGLTHAQSPVG